MGLSLFLGATEIVAGLLIIVRRDYYASRVAPHRVGRARAFLLGFGVLSTLVGAIQIAELAI